jgi:hypothetical protein
LLATLAPYSTKAITLKNQSQEQWRAIRPLTHWLRKKISNEKRGNPKYKGLRKKTSDEKRRNPKMQGAKKKDI